MSQTCEAKRFVGVCAALASPIFDVVPLAANIFRQFKSAGIFFRQVAMPLDSNAQTRKKKGKKEIRTLAESVEDPFAMIETVASDKQLINSSEFRMALPVQGRISERAGSTRTMCHDFVGKISTSQTLGLCIDL